MNSSAKVPSGLETERLRSLLKASGQLNGPEPIQRELFDNSEPPQQLDLLADTACAMGIMT